MTKITHCRVCGKSLSATTRSKGSCIDCYLASKAKKPITCAHCGKDFIPVKKGRFCNLACFSASRIASSRTVAPPPPVPDCVWVPLTQGKFALIDQADASRVLADTWCAVKARPNMRNDIFYAKNTRTNEYLHRFIFGVTDSYTSVDHVNGNGLDCRQDNLRRANRFENSSNRLVTVGKASGFKGVHATQSNKWVVRYVRHSVELCGGTFKSKEEAALEYDRIIRQYKDPFSTYNFPRSGERSAITGEVIK